MKKATLTILLAAALLLTGCSSLIPKQVELFQKKVKEFPVAKPREEEVQKQAAAMAAEKAQETLVSAVAENSSTNVVRPATETVDLTRSVSTSLGPPAKPWQGEVKQLSTKLDTDVAALNSRIEGFKNRNDDLAGKKIEDTGLLKVPYFVWLGGALVVGFIAMILVAVGWTVFKVYAATNPIAGAASGAIGLAASLAHRGFEQVVSGGENFKGEVTSQLVPALTSKIAALLPANQSSQETAAATANSVAAQVLALFRNEQMKAQDKDIQSTVGGLTK